MSIAKKRVLLRKNIAKKRVLVKKGDLIQKLVMNNVQTNCL